MKFLHEFIKYSNGEVEDNGWWEIQGNKLVNRMGGWHDYSTAEDDIIVEAESWDRLDWSCLIKPDSPYGWIDLDGVFYGCDYHDHDSLARLYFKSDERTLEMIGFVKIYRSFNRTTAYYVERYLTAKQEATLLERGIRI